MKTGSEGITKDEKRGLTASLEIVTTFIFSHNEFSTYGILLDLPHQSLVCKHMRCRFRFEYLSNSNYLDSTSPHGEN